MRATLFSVTLAVCSLGVAEALDVLYVVDYSYGNLFPFYGTGKALQARGHHVAIAGVDELRSDIEKAGFDFVSAGPSEHSSEDLKQILYENMDDFIGVMNALEPVFTSWHKSMGQALHAQYVGPSKTLQRPDVIITVVGAWAGKDLADLLEAPLHIWYVPTCIFDMDEPPFYARVPTPISGLPAKGTFLQRAQNVVMRALFGLLADQLIAEPNQIRAELGLGSAGSPFSYGGISPAIVLTSFGFEVARSLPPHVKLVGPVVREATPLAESVQQWVEADDSPVVYVAMGTIMQVSTEKAAAITRGLLRVPRVRVLWSTSAPYANEALATLSPAQQARVMVAPFVAQVALLQHANVKAFVSHCGANSLYESLYAGTPVLALPLALDAFDLSARATESGAAMLMDYKLLTADSVFEAASHMLSHPSFAERAHWVAGILKASGGGEAAATYVEYLAEFGFDHLVPVQRQQASSAFAYYQGDVMLFLGAIVLVLVLLLVKLLRMGWACCCGGSKGASEANKKKKM
mmetsp:Transcript_2452/g.2885  ORF Transcript_2452/g.2885 Transcript_2452/m.2885 type:complete len:520 (-) Transcript_2452:178-1737(-)|eukprot:CAMPEP_0205829664 /NCGR_PEP_ID=MMETSP0206-20130828/38816_1 /ASSEMBLY_ACC=CAM_ASM_000279 /TAXON_ID=36767 /ORGANISM="Euplotes focardii, Strain TN1" /LENGTH=519 /DNA_ID=CAMNT_0053132589 /DNA_START=21 /DNA_END=1580 /DNA_ORIENTATION=+